MDKKKASHTSVDFCPKDGTPACCVKKRKCPGPANPFDEVDIAVRNAWLELSSLEPGIKDIKKLFAKMLLTSYLSQCTHIGLTERETKMLLGKELKRYYERVNHFRNIAKLHIEKD